MEALHRPGSDMGSPPGARELARADTVFRLLDSAGFTVDISTQPDRHARPLHAIGAVARLAGPVLRLAAPLDTGRGMALCAAGTRTDCRHRIRGGGEASPGIPVRGRVHDARSNPERAADRDRSRSRATDVS